MLRPSLISIAPTTRRRAALLGAVLAGVPVVVTAWSLVAAPTFFDPMGYRRPEVLGIPVQLIIMAFAVAWGGIGGYVVGTSRSTWVRALAIMVFTLPACVAIILGPAIILILQNLVP